MFHISGSRRYEQWLPFKTRAPGEFRKVSYENQSLIPERKDAPAPFSLRLSTKERAYLEELAGKRPIGAYIRDRLLGEKAVKRRRFRK